MAEEVKGLGLQSREAAAIALMRVLDRRGHPLGNAMVAAQDVLTYHANEPVIVMRLSEAIEKGLVLKKEPGDLPSFELYGEYDLSKVFPGH